MKRLRTTIITILLVISMIAPQCVVEATGVSVSIVDAIKSEESGKQGDNTTKAGDDDTKGNKGDSDDDDTKDNKGDKDDDDTKDNKGDKDDDDTKDNKVDNDDNDTKDNKGDNDDDDTKDNKGGNDDDDPKQGNGDDETNADKDADKTGTGVDDNDAENVSNKGKELFNSLSLLPIFPSSDATSPETSLLLKKSLPGGSLFAMLGATPDSDPDPDSGSTQPKAGERNGSGSFQLNKIDDDYRFYTEYFVKGEPGKSIDTADIQRKTVIKVYAKGGETILFGSSVYDSEIDENDNSTNEKTGADIVITKPNNNKVPKNVIEPGKVDDEDTLRPNGLGYIANHTQEEYGPIVNEADEGNDNYYVPLKYDVPEDEGGVYTFEFHSVTGINYQDNSGKVPTKALAKDSWNQGLNAVAAWDVTVLGKNNADKWEVKKGRAWADYLALTTADGSVKADLDVHVLSHDGYLYEVNFKEAVPHGIIFFANNTGFMTTVTVDGHESRYPIYHSFYDDKNDLSNMTDNENIVLHKPYELDTDTEETYKIFFNEPSEDLAGVHADNDPSSKKSKIKIEPEETVKLSNLTFKGIGNHENIAIAGQGGYVSFNSDGEAMVTIRLDLRKAIADSEATMGSYKGSGIVEFTVPTKEGENRFYWDGKDTEGVVLPAGIYGNNNVVLSTEIKRGEIHFPVIDMEGLKGGLKIERKNGGSKADKYDLYYNNNPLAYGTIEGNQGVPEGKYYKLTDGTKSYNLDGKKYFETSKPKTISTLVKDTKDYLAKKLYDKNYSQLSLEQREIIDAEFGIEGDTYHFEPVNSSITTMKFDGSGNNGGGNQAGIDAWTYYVQGIETQTISFALLDSENMGMVRGKIFYDTNKDTIKGIDTEEPLLPNIKVRLMTVDSEGKANPVVHKVKLPCFDELGYFVYDKNGQIVYEEKDVNYEAITDSKGTYRFTGVPLDTSTNYYVQVLLTDVQSEVLRYTCTTSEKIKEEYKDSSSNSFLTWTTNSGYPDGNRIIGTTDISKLYMHKYDRDTKTNETIFDKENAKAIDFSSVSSTSGIIEIEVKNIGYCSTVPEAHQKNYKVEKAWGETHKISDGLIVELWVWNDKEVKEENTLNLSRRTGALVDTQVLNEENSWQYTWKNLDDRLQYYVLEYYTKKKPNGEIIYNDKGEPRKVLIGGTMPIFSTLPEGTTIGTNDYYAFNTDLGDYPTKEYTIEGKQVQRIQMQRFNESASDNKHPNAITQKEKLESIDNNARQYDVVYELSQSGATKTNTIKLFNSQVYDDRTYYVWLNHQRELPDMIAQTYVEDGKRKSHAVTLQREMDPAVTPDDSDTRGYFVKGLSVSSLDAADSKNIEGNSTNAFRIKDDNGTGVLFTANEITYKTGTGTRTYRVKYVVDKTYKKPVSVSVKDGELVLTSNENIKVEDNKEDYIVYSWFMTIHVYDLEPDGVIEYDSKGGPINLQSALEKGTELKWTRTRDEKNKNAITYTSNDPRKSGILKNDIFRVPLYKDADDPDMGSCADLVGIAYAGSKVIDDKDAANLIYADTYASRYGEGTGSQDGTAIVHGSGGYVTAVLNTERTTRINRTQDHANYASVTFTPENAGLARMAGNGVDVFYYKVVVFAEDNTYQYYKYDEITAVEGVEMYSYFIMKDISQEYEPDDDVYSEGSSSGIPGNLFGVKPQEIDLIAQIEADPKEELLTEKQTAEKNKRKPVPGGSPKTGDESNLLLWTCFIGLGWTFILTGLHKKRNARKK